MALTFNLPSQIVVQTAAQWAVDATVYSNKRILVISDAYYGSTDQRKFKIADGTQTWAQLDYMPISQTLAQVLANGSSTNAVSFKSPDSLTELLVANNNIDAYVDDTSNVSEINITPNTIVISTTGASIDLSATSVTKNSSEILTSSNITQVITNGVTDKAPSEDAVYDALASIRNVYQIITGTLAPADSTTYYSNATADTTANFSTNIAVYRCQIPITGTIKECSIVVFNNNSPTTEASTLILRNLTTSTDYTLSNGVTFDSTNGVWKPLTIITGLNIPISAGDNFVLKLTTPAWSTNPTSIRIAVNLSISA